MATADTFHLQAFHWLSKNKIPLFILDFDGTVISSVLPPMPVKADLRAAQLEASQDARKKLFIAYALIEAKIARSLQVLEWLAERYDIAKELRIVKREAIALKRAKSPSQVRSSGGACCPSILGNNSEDSSCIILTFKAE